MGIGMPKNIAIFSDGTGQAGGIPRSIPSNVYRMFSACPVIAGVQAIFYEHGVGAPVAAARPGRRRQLRNALSRMTGLGINENIADCYDALIRLYEPGDRIFLFGFSRGGYAVRSVGGVLGICGIPRYSPHGLDLRKDHRARRRAVLRAVRGVYQSYGSGAAGQKQRQARAATFRKQHASHEDGVVPYFIGVWDTVRAIGLPGVSSLIFWRHKFHDSALNPGVPYGRHALSIDENRAMFFPELWDEAESDRISGRIKQVWFPGVHSDVGGGYAERELADLTLNWMIDEATAIPNPLIVDRSKLDLKPSHRGIQHDERRGLGRLWRKGTRETFQSRAHTFEDNVQKRLDEQAVPTLDGERAYRPPLLARLPQFVRYYEALDARRRGLLKKLNPLEY